jgi:hypothetical protein
LRCATITHQIAGSALLGFHALQCIPQRNGNGVTLVKLIETLKARSAWATVATTTVSGHTLYLAQNSILIWSQMDSHSASMCNMLEIRDFLSVHSGIDNGHQKKQ